MNKYFVLKTIPFFSDFSEGEISKTILESDIVLKKIPEEDYILFQGDELTSAIFLLRGKLKATKILENGKMIELERFTDGAIIAPAFLFAEINDIPVDLQAMEDSEIVFIERESFLNFLMAKKNALRKFLEISSNKTQIMSGRAINMAKTIGEKVDTYIMENSEGEKIKFKLTIKELAEKFGVERPSLSRVLSMYVKKGYLTKLEKNSYKIEKKFYEKEEV